MVADRALISGLDNDTRRAVQHLHKRTAAEYVKLDGSNTPMTGNLDMGSSVVVAADGAFPTPSIRFSGNSGTGVFLHAGTGFGILADSEYMAILNDTAVYTYRPHYSSGGTVSIPAYTFQNDTNTGIYNPGADQLGFSTNGVNRLNITTTGITSTIPVLGAAGAASGPGYAFSAETSMGMYRKTTSTLAFSTNSADRVIIDATNRWAPRTTYTPSVFGITFGSGGYATGVYSVIDGWCRGAIRVVLGTTAPTVGTGAYISLPSGFAIHSTYMTSSIGPVTAYDATGALNIGHAMAVYTTAVEPRFQMTAGSAALSQISATVPITWAANDYLTIHFNYPIAY